jgi:pimeloyl-ACP methyl ester carboxylesterase
VIIVAALLLAIYFAIRAVVVAQLTLPARPVLGAYPASYGVLFEDVSFRPHGESITLSGWFMPNPASKRAIVVVHGFGLGGCRTCGFKNRLAEFAAGLQRRGFDVLLFDLISHGQSDDARYTLRAAREA